MTNRGYCRIVVLIVCCMNWACHTKADEITAFLEGQFGSADTIGSVDVSNSHFRVEMTFSVDTVDSLPKDGRGWFFGKPAILTSKQTGAIVILNDGDPPNHNGDTLLDVINNEPVEGTYWFGFDFPGFPTGLAALFKSPVFGDPDSPSAFGPVAPENGFVYSFNSIETSIGQFSSAKNQYRFLQNLSKRIF